ncbi:MAG TPA: ferritin-like domain-containing protein [Paenalcaligenes hominis]|uniref:Bacterioferritin n=1 Tax=Paenalcaligenes hominis TaxID=643674 RepID=A0A9D3AAA5_9BURK|nr:ferritin-like domain-containing protein [Paenalcaligenes hominis]NJB65871.1 bacterioferritin [Paenalcaligenes hominis]GGE70333.1 bacterioferritin [Paenalcaligenes hominis]HJH23958.1 ferritin-like domain-containing protein [Paenalcaligenes hominis]
MSKQNSILDVEAIREAARKHVEDGAVASGYQGDREKIISMLNEALATEWVCVLRYMRHYFTATGIHNESIKAEFLEHAQQEQAHADRIAERIVQLNGEPDLDPATLTQRSHAEYDTSMDIKDMIRANLIAERIAIESYRQMIVEIGDSDPTTRQMLVEIMASEEEHADEMSDLLGL